LSGPFLSKGLRLRITMRYGLNAVLVVRLDIHII